MALDNANYIDELSITDPTATDLVSQGDDQIRTVKRAVKQSFPSVDIAVNAIHTSATAPAVSIAEGLVWIDTSAGAGNHVAKVYDGSSFIVLPFSVETAQKVDVNDGTIDGTIIGGSSVAAGTFAALEGTAVKATTSLTLDTAATVIFEGATANAHETTVTVTDPTADRTITLPDATDTLVGKATTDTLTNKTLTSPVVNTGISGSAVLDSDTMSGANDTTVATSESIKAYVDAQVTAQDLDVISDSGTIDIDLDSESLTVAGGSGLNTSATGSTLTVAGDDATTSAKGVASFSSDNFGVSSGAVTIKDAGVANAELDNMAANTIKVRDANSSGVPSDKALADTQILIGDGTGFTAAALSGDATMANTGAVSVVKIQGQDVSATAATNDQYLKYSSASSEWQKVDVVAPDRLTTKGDLLGYNPVDSETRLPVGANGKFLQADSTATNGVSWQTVADNAAAMALALGG